MVTTVDEVRAAASQGRGRVLGRRLPRRRLRELEALGDPLEHLLGPRAPSRSASAPSLEQHFGDRSDGSFTVVFALSPRAGTTIPAAKVQGRAAVGDAPRRGRAAARLARAVQRRRPRREARGSSTATSSLRSTLAEAKGYTDTVRRALGRPPGVRHVYVTGAAAIQHDLDPSSTATCGTGELMIALPIALLVLLAVFGLSWAVDDPARLRRLHDHRARSGSSTASRSVWATPTYATNLVQLIGLGIAVDYSLLIVYRFREELALGTDVEDGRRADDGDGRPRGRLLGHRGRARARAAARDAAAVHPHDRRRRLPDPDRLDRSRRSTLQPVLLSLLRPPWHRRASGSLPGASRSIAGAGLLGAPRARDHAAAGRSSSSPGRRSSFAAAIPAFWLQLTPGSTFGIPRTPQSVRGFDVLRAAVGAGRGRRRRRCWSTAAPRRACSRAPAQAAIAAARRRRSSATRRSRRVYTGRGGPFVDPSAHATSR